MKRYFAYIRVSTVKQGEKGSSLQEQRSAIEAYARRHDLSVVEWFEERETAAKQGRVVFSRMLSALHKERAAGVITHKIDRSARNLRDWATLGELLDRGIELHFAHESIDLSSRGGRLSADIQAVVAADFIRNLREETRKGFYGRLKQGLYPLRAPLGYLDQGRGNAKIIDPIRGPLIKRAFDLYSAGTWSLDSLGNELYALGLRNRYGNRVSRNGISTILNNSFYVGLIQIEKTGETFCGIHEPLISKSKFDNVQSILQGHSTHKVLSHQYLYQRCVRCASCNYSLIAERQKGRVYYRCHTQSCRGQCLREDQVTAYLRSISVHFQFSAEEWAAVLADVDVLIASVKARHERERNALIFSISAIDDRVSRLTDAFIDQLIDKDTYTERKARLLNDRVALTSRKVCFDAGDDELARALEKNLELIKSLGNMPDLDFPTELRNLLKHTTSNFSARGKELEISWAYPFNMFVKSHGVPAGDPNRIKHRTTTRISTLNKLIRRMIKSKQFPSAVSTKPSEPSTKLNAGWQALEKFNRERRSNKEGGTGNTEASPV